MKISPAEAALIHADRWTDEWLSRRRFLVLLASKRTQWKTRNKEQKLSLLWVNTN